MTSPPKPPAGLLKASRDRWRQFWESGSARAVDLDSDMPRLIRWILASDEYDRAAKVIRAARIVKGSMGQPVLNPLVAYLTQLEAMITRTETEFGMTPAARQRLKVEGGSLEDELEQLFGPVTDDDAGPAPLLAKVRDEAAPGA